MSLRIASEHLADLRHDAPLLIARAADADVTSRSLARLLITAPTQQGVETLAHRVHETGLRAQFPFVHTWARDLPVEPERLKEYCMNVLAAAAGGSVLVSAVEEMPPAVQDALSDLLAALEFTRSPSAKVRLISGTTVSLLDRVAAGTFSGRLFYRLNILHLMAGDSPLKLRAHENSMEVYLRDVSPPARAR
jgi:DNA-binding NtrC family response regulator